MRDIFAEATRRIIEAIEAGAGECRMPWHQSGDAVHAPRNAVTSRPYRGINTLLLWAAGEARQFSSGRWATYRQWSEAGAQVRKGEQATTIFFWKPTQGPGDGLDDGRDRDERDRSSPRFLARVYHVFNATQVQGYDPAAAPTLPESERITEAEDRLGLIPAVIRHGGDDACYVPSVDEIRLPSFGQFRTPRDYYSVLAHELVHWSGAKQRLNRDLAGRFGSQAYAMEELVAELGAAFMMSHLGLGCEPRCDHAPYISSWLKILADDSRAIITAAGKAQEAVDHLMQFAAVSDANSAVSTQSV